MRSSARTVRSVILRAGALLLASSAGGATQPPSAPRAPRAPSRYLFVWAGPHGSDATVGRVSRAPGADDFLAVLDADPASRTYGRVLASRAVGTVGAMAHHTELTLPAGHPLFASDFVTGQIFLLDVGDPLAPRVAARIDGVPGYRRPHSFARLPNGHVVATLQFGDGARAGDPGGLAEFDAAGRLLRTRSAADAAFAGARIRPNGIELLPAIDRALTTSMPMDDERTADVVQVWRLSDLRLLHTLVVPHPAGDTAAVLPYDTRVLADGRTAMLDTYYCRLYRIAGLETDAPRVTLVHVLGGPRAEGCAVAAVVGHYLVVPEAYGHVVVSLDVADPAHPVEVSTLRTDPAVLPHWVSADPRGGRVVVTGADEGEARVLVARLDPRTGALAWDERFRDAGSARNGVSFDRAAWPHGRVVHVMAHGALFGPASP